MSDTPYTPPPIFRSAERLIAKATNDKELRQVELMMRGKAFVAVRIADRERLTQQIDARSKRLRGDR